MNHENPKEAIVFTKSQRMIAGRFRWAGVKARQEGLCITDAPHQQSGATAFETFCRLRWQAGWEAWHMIEIEALVREVEHGKECTQ